MAVALAFCLIASLAYPARAAIDVAISASTEQGFGRLLLIFPERPRYKLDIKSGVLVIRFEQPARVRLDGVAGNLPDYIVVGRLDPDGTALRFALARKLKVNTIEAGEKLFIDLLPEEWSGVPPGLPKAVIADLARRAETAAKIVREEAERKTAQAKKYKLKIHSGVQPTFSRLAFEWTELVKTRLERNGKTVIVKFSEKVVPDLSRLKADPPRFVAGVEHEFKGDELWIRFQIDPRSDVRGFQEEKTYIVDVFAPPESVGEGSGAGKAAEAGTRSTRPNSKDGATRRRELIKFGGEVAPAASTGAATEAQSDEKAPVTQAAPGRLVKSANPGGKTSAGVASAPGPGLVPGVIVSERTLDRDGLPADAKPDATPAAAPGPVRPAARTTASARRQPPEPGAPAAPATPAAPAVTAAGPPPATDAAGDAPKSAQAASKKPVTATPQERTPVSRIVAKVRDSGSSLRITFPFDAPTSAAVFQRAKYLWIVFDTRQPIGIREIEMTKSQLLQSARLHKISDETQVLRLEMTAPVLATANASGNDWVVSLGDLIIEPTAPITLKRGLRSDGGAKLSVRFDGAGKVHWLKDPSIGDTIAVVTGQGPPRGFIKPQDFVEFAVLATAHGIAIQRKNDDLSVKLVRNDVVITNKDGLTLSGEGVRQYAPGRRTLTHSSRSGFIDFDGWSQGGPKNFTRQVGYLEYLIVSAPAKKSISPRLELTRLYLAHRLGAEALGQMKRIIEVDPEVETEPTFNAMRGVANLMMVRLGAARKYLSVHDLSQDRNAALWLGLTEARAHNWRRARQAFRKGERSIRKYPDEIQAMFRVAAARVAIETNDLGAAEFNLNVIPKRSLPISIAADVLVLRGRLLQGLGRNDAALDVYDKAAASGDQKAEAEARFHATLLKLKLKKISDEKAVPDLEAVSLMWRGDDLELRVQRNLALLYTRRGKYRQALTVMRTAIETYPEKPTTRLLQDDMSELFAKLFLSGAADELEPVVALGLYYDFRALTPVGRKGDEMIRKLAARLVAVDLLDQAAEILAHQVDRRLTGAARAQVAERLAIVHLLNHKPRRALLTLRRTRQSVLPGKLKRQRVMLEARALAELTRSGAAVSLLEHLEGADVDQLRALAYWNGEKWQKAGEAYEKVLGEKWQASGELKSGERLDVMRAVISYSLAEDSIGLRRLADRFSKKMQNSPDGRAFRVLAHAVDRQGVEFRNLAKEIAAIDTLESFLAEFGKSFDAVDAVANKEAKG